MKDKQTMKIKTPEFNLEKLYEHCPARLENILTTYMAEIPSLDLKSAMEYTLLNGGKRLRPLLIYATGQIFQAPLENLDIPACAVELIHTYSLIHDDLPCMDDADLRRGKASCHKVFGEGMAVLTGDALHTLAMQIIASHPSKLSAEKRVQMMKTVSHACGPFGMAAGQALDITILQSETISADLLQNIYELKTGALFTACFELGRLSSNDEDDVTQKALQKFGTCIGFAFQIQDDVLDIEANTQQLGKLQGTDIKNHKTTYPKLFGLREAKEKIHSLYQQGLEAINFLGDRAQLVRELTGSMLRQV
jgi:farnesyl diphosphate synthase